MSLRERKGAKQREKTHREGWGIPFDFDRGNKSSQLWSGPSKRGQVTLILIICKFKVLPAHSNLSDLVANRPMAIDRDLNVPWMLVKCLALAESWFFTSQQAFWRWLDTVAVHTAAAANIIWLNYGPNVITHTHFQSCFKAHAFPECLPFIHFEKLVHFGTMVQCVIELRSARQR